MAGARVGRNEVGLDEDLVCGQAALDELVAGELAEGDKAGNLALPGVSQAMRREHESDYGGGGIGLAVTSVLHAPPQGSPQAFFTNFAVAKKIGRQAQQAEIGRASCRERV